MRRRRPQPPVGLLDRLHANGRAFVEQLKNAGPLLLVLDECHHLLEVWGRLIGELLDQLPNALVLGLTATPPEALTADQALLVDELFGAPLYRVSIPAVVKVGDLAPFVELAWLTTPTPSEDDWLAEEAERFRELITQLTDPSFGSMPFLQWLDARFVASRSPWLTLVKEQPDVCRAVLRLHHVGMIGLPSGARMQEEHRSAPTADDWVLLVDDWLTGRLTKTGLPQDEQVVEAVRRALPSVGYQWTKRGIRRGRSPVDRVLARSESKTRGGRRDLRARAPQPRRADADAGALRPRAGRRHPARRPDRGHRPAGRFGARDAGRPGRGAGDRRPQPDAGHRQDGRRRAQPR